MGFSDTLLKLAFKTLAKHSGENVAKNVQQGKVRVPDNAWVLLSANGSSNLSGRTHVRLQTRGKAVGVVLALQYAIGTTTNGFTWSFTAPASSVSVGESTQFRGTATWVEPVGEQVQIYGRMLLKAGATGSSSLNVIVTEYA